MGNFSVGIFVGTVVGAGLMMAVNPMDKKKMKKAYRRAGKMMHKMNHRLHAMC